MILLNQLQQLGLSEKEAKVYLASLELGSSSVQDISRKAGVNRPTTYVQVESLVKKGLMSSLIRGKKRYFSAESPEQLTRLLTIQKKEIENKKKDLENILPELTNIFDLAEEKPKVRFFEGIEGFRTMYRDIIKTKCQTLEAVIPIDDADKVFSSYPKYKSGKKSKIIPIRTIYTSKKGRILPLSDGLTKRRFVPIDKFPFSAEINIYGDKIAIFSMRSNLVGVIIENKEITDTLRHIFNLSWLAAEDYKK